MENASKALIMAGSMLIAIVIITIGVYVFTYFGDSTKKVQEQIEAKALEEFNNNFEKYRLGENCTLHDVLSLANFARKYNKDIEAEDVNDKHHIHVYLGPNKTNEFDLANIEKYDDDKFIDMLKSEEIINDANTGHHVKYYECKDIGMLDERVNYIWFKEKT